jgi:hypothetical protein
VPDDDPGLFPRAEVGATVCIAAGAAAGASQVDATGPILVFADAIIVAIVTWFSTDRRQARELRADARKQERALAAEGKRQAAALAHARELADLSDMRKLLDEASVTLHRAAYATGVFRVRFLHHGLNVSEKAPTAVQDLYEIGKELDTLTACLAVRLGRDHDVAREFAAADAEMLALYQTVIAIIGLVPPEDRQEMREAVDKAGRDFAEHRSSFEAAAITFAGSRLTSAPEM